MVTSLDEKYMRTCLSLALKGKGNVAPNPMVGCVVLDKNGKVVSKGYHKKYGKNHAERDALTKLINNEAEGGTLYVNLEPCSHYGKTPPCVDLIIEHKLARVVFAMRDPNPKVNGIDKLKKAGIEVVEGILEDEAKFLNRVFVKNITQQMPYVVLKTATTMDGKIATKTGSSKWITSSEARDEVYKMRKDFDCIMTSSNTVIADNPTMEHKFKCVIDRHGKTKSDAKIYQQGKIHISTKSLKETLRDLYNEGACTVFVECGGTLAGALLKENLIDEVYQFIAPKILNDNNGFSCFNGDDVEDINKAKNLNIYEIKQVGKDILIKGTFS